MDDGLSLPQVLDWMDICVCMCVIQQAASYKINIICPSRFHSAFSCRSALLPLEIYVA